MSEHETGVKLIIFINSMPYVDTHEDAVTLNNIASDPLNI